MKTKTKIQNTNVKNYFPFNIVQNDNKFLITLGNTQIVSHEFVDAESAYKYIKNKPYELIINACCYAMEMTLKMKGQENEQENQ